MGFKLFKSNEDKMKEAMIFGISPEGWAVKTSIEKLFYGLSEDFSMVQYRQIPYSTPPLNELILLKVGLGMEGIGIAYYEDGGYFFISRSKLLPIKEKLLSALARTDDTSSIAWLALIKLAWENGVPLAGIKYFREGFEAAIFIKDQNPRKKFVETKEPM